MPDELWSIGRFALATGLTINALRHYDEVGVLRPAAVDPVTGYRRYRAAQLGRARNIVALRGLDLPVSGRRRLPRRTRRADPTRAAASAPVGSRTACPGHRRETRITRPTRQGRPQFGTFPDDSFLLLTVDQSGTLGPAAFGLMVADVDAIYATAVEAGARSHTAPADYAWKPRSACVIDPSGNLVTVYQS